MNATFSQCSQCSQCSTMITIINPSVVRPQSYISYALVGKFFSLSDTYLHLSIHTYRYNNNNNNKIKKWGSDSKYPKRAIKCDKIGWRAGTREKKASKWISFSLSLFTNCRNEAERFFIYIHYLGKRRGAAFTCF